MKDVIRHLRHTQKKILRSARKEESYSNINNSFVNQNLIKGEVSSFFQNIK